MILTSEQWLLAIANWSVYRPVSDRPVSGRGLLQRCARKLFLLVSIVEMLKLPMHEKLFVRLSSRNGSAYSDHMTCETHLALSELEAALDDRFRRLTTPHCFRQTTAGALRREKSCR